MQTREEWLARYEAWKSEPKYILKITVEEHKRYFELSKFQCPIGYDPKDCNGNPCPTRPDDIWEDYFLECIKARNARNHLLMVLDGSAVVQHDKHKGWEMPV